MNCLCYLMQKHTCIISKPHEGILAFCYEKGMESPFRKEKELLRRKQNPAMPQGPNLIQKKKARSGDDWRTDVTNFITIMAI